ncbi:tRNA 2'-phosphotransferase 1 [Thoreauomyces humboldtii]|nr:tRNA 2'-phosphotransferase 1 [Thoreauomyces humboldtii]
MSYVLRHGAEKDGVPIRADGYILISDLVKHKRLRNVTFETIQEIVEGNDKQRFTLLQEGNIWAIRANQGHSIDVKVDMTPITKPSEQPIVIHGTSTKAWETIAKEGLRPMSRQHIHFAPGRPTDQGVISGMRTTCTVYIYIDMVKALAAGIPFSRSSNNVILSPGNKDGIIPREFFRKVEDRDGNIIG